LKIRKTTKWQRRRRGGARMQYLAKFLHTKYICGKGKVWITDIVLDPDGIEIEIPKQVKLKHAKESDIVLCSCGCYAKRLDRYWPYQDERNFCKGCLDRKKDK